MVDFGAKPVLRLCVRNMTAANGWTSDTPPKWSRGSPWRPDRLPGDIDRSAIVSCQECGSRFLNQQWLDMHLEGGHRPHKEDEGISKELQPKNGASRLSLSQMIARDIIERIESGELHPGQQIISKELMTRHGHSAYPVQMALRLLTRYGIIDRTGEAMHTVYRVASR
jgi:hypothetical protein